MAKHRLFSLREKFGSPPGTPVARGGKARLFAERKATMLTPGFRLNELT